MSKERISLIDLQERAIKIVSLLNSMNVVFPNNKEENTVLAIMAGLNDCYNQAVYNVNHPTEK